MSLSNDHRVAVMLPKDLDAVAHGFDYRSSDKDGAEPFDLADADIGLERVDLPAVRVPPNGDVHHAQPQWSGMFTRDLSRHKDHPRARSVHGHPGSGALGQGLQQTKPVQEFADGRGLSAGKNERIDRMELLRPLHHHRSGTGGIEGAHVLAHITLKPEHTDLHIYQPRVAKRSSGRRSETLMPTIASPRPRDTLAMISGSE